MNEGKWHRLVFLAKEEESGLRMHAASPVFNFPDKCQLAASSIYSSFFRLTTYKFK